MPKLKPAAAVAKSALTIYLAPKLAQDAQISWGPICAAASVKDKAVRREGTLKAVKLATDGKLAKDADIEDVVEVIDAIESMQDEIADVAASGGDPDPDPDPDDDTSKDDITVAPTVEAMQQLREFLAGKLGPEDMAQIDELLAATPAKAAAEDEDDDDDEKRRKEKDAEDKRMGKDWGVGKDRTPITKDNKVAKDKEPEPMITKAAMDAAIAEQVKAAVAEATKTADQRGKEIRDAERFVRPWVGDMTMACDSAEGVYRQALTTLGEDVKGINGVLALKKILELKPRAGASPRRSGMAHDSGGGAGTGGLAERFPAVANIRVGTGF